MWKFDGNYSKMNVEYILPADEILSYDELLKEQEYYQTDVAFRNNDEILKWLAKRRLIRNENTCDYCEVPMYIVEESTICDGFRWRCRSCRRIKTVRDFSFFTRSRLSLHQLVTILYMWCRGIPQKCILHEARLSPVAQKTLTDFCYFCSEICGEDLLKNCPTIGGLDEDCQPKVVEIDETCFWRQKNNCEKSDDGQWVFGGVERDTGKCILAPIPNRSAETLLPLIERHILPGTIIISDAWEAYKDIGEINSKSYEHETVMHDTEISDSVHICNMENLWLSLKRRACVQFGTSKKLFDSYLNEYVWRNNSQNQKLFHKFLVCLNQQYNLYS